MHSRYLLFLLLILGSIGSAAQEHYRVVFLNTNPNRETLPPEQVDSLQKGHMANIDRLWREGVLLAAGPFDGGGGIFIFQDFSAEHVDEILSSDPAISAGRFIIEHYRLTVPMGAICPVSEGYTMTYYSFIRYESSISYQISPVPESLKEHLIYMETRPAVIDIKMMGWFDELPGCGILVLGNEMSREISDWLDGDPFLQGTGISYTYRKLWMAEGIYCDF